jgi:arylformamidase
MPSPDVVSQPFIRDISIPLREGFPVWPGHTPPSMTCTQTHEAGHGVQLTHLSLGAHTGTHLDAPRHFVAGAGLVTELDLHALVGPVRVVRYPGDGPIPVSFFEEAGIAGTAPRRILLRCDRNAGALHDRGSEFFEDYAAVTPEAAQWLVERGVRLIGTDYLSIGPFSGGNHEVHVTLLSAGMIIVEGLDLRMVEPGDYTLVCLPLALPCDGAPCRAVLLPAGALPETL